MSYYIIQYIYTYTYYIIHTLYHKFLEVRARGSRRNAADRWCRGGHREVNKNLGKHQKMVKNWWWTSLYLEKHHLWIPSFDCWVFSHVLLSSTFRSEAEAKKRREELKARCSRLILFFFVPLVSNVERQWKHHGNISERVHTGTLADLGGLAVRLEGSAQGKRSPFILLMTRVKLIGLCERVR